jgi:acyl-CoA synthetase (AMP-forming)/AMP-acid ligase II
MLYQRWRQVAEDSGGRIALRDLASGRSWTFEELAAHAENGSIAPGRIAFPQGNSSDFIFSVLKAWRGDQVVCALEAGQAIPLIADHLPKEVKHLKGTSATTGAQRWVAFKPEQLIADAENIVRTMGLTANWPNLGVISLAHSYGFSNLVLPLLLHGIPLILVGSGLPEAVRRAAASEKELTLAGVPALWGKWHESNAIPGNIRVAISAGAPLPLKLEQAVFNTHALKIHNFYGSTECGGIAYDSSSEPRGSSSCAGSPMKGVALRVNETGCLEVRGNAVGETYWPDSHSNLANGVFRTSDLAEVSEGLVYLHGRVGDQINVAGRKVLPEIIEEALASHPDVSACVAFGVPSSDPERGETIVACLAAKPNVSGDMLKEYIMHQLPSWQVPRRYWFVESLGANARGKISRSEWRKRYLESLTQGGHA